MLKLDENECYNRWINVNVCKWEDWEDWFELLLILLKEYLFGVISFRAVYNSIILVQY